MNLLKSNDLSLVIGDVHIAPGQSMDRARLLGMAINELEPNRVIFIGDFLNFDSLSAWDKDKRKKMEGRRYQKDIDSGKKFLETMDNKVISGDPEYIFIEGNHEDRLWRYLDGQPLFDGAIDYRET